MRTKIKVASPKKTFRQGLFLSRKAVSTIKSRLTSYQKEIETVKLRSKQWELYSSQQEKYYKKLLIKLNRKYQKELNVLKK
jgi:hypothetical protein